MNTFLFHFPSSVFFFTAVPYETAAFWWFYYTKPFSWTIRKKLKIKVGFFVTDLSDLVLFEYTGCKIRANTGNSRRKYRHVNIRRNDCSEYGKLIVPHVTSARSLILKNGEMAICRIAAFLLCCFFLKFPRFFILFQTGSCTPAGSPLYFYGTPCWNTYNRHTPP